MLSRQLQLTPDIAGLVVLAQELGSVSVFSSVQFGPLQQEGAIVLVILIKSKLFFLVL